MTREEAREIVEAHIEEVLEESYYSELYWVTWEDSVVTLTWNSPLIEDTQIEFDPDDSLLEDSLMSWEV